MRITHVIDYFHTDVGYQEFYLAKFQADAGHTVHVVTSEHRHHTVAHAGPDEVEGARMLADRGVEVIRLPARQLGHDRAWVYGLEGALRATRPEAVHCHGPFCPTTVRVARTMSKASGSLLVDNHIQSDIAPAASTPLGRATYGAYRAAFRPTLVRAVDSWVAIGPYEGDFLADRLTLDPTEIDLVPHGFDPEFFHWDATRRDAVRGDRGWSDDLVIAVTGKLHARKRVDLTATAAEEVAKHRRVRLVLAGSVDDDVRAAVHAAAPTLSGAGRIAQLPLLGRQALADLYLASDVVVFARLPSISIYEAAGTGVDVVVGMDRFGDWLAGMCSSIHSVAPNRLAAALTASDDRARSAKSAMNVFSWAQISRAFEERYRAAL